ncbi:hypothetical protein EV382_2919 [Micromonospora violae]|uniref:Uncharacterized protein n=1 Tax=Micromonospora violae TaxID=1278207 RepID=A0A4Q7UH30_9ACTN|nr:hypothetical protein [Micromonospora violae]RZT79688.1 hypothetical protein EV382_2919 [Micromonospora violae]
MALSATTPIRPDTQHNRPRLRTARRAPGASNLGGFSAIDPRFDQGLVDLLGILTSNYLIRHTDVGVRRGTLVKPDRSMPFADVLGTRGLTGTHRRLTESDAAQHCLR